MFKGRVIEKLAQAEDIDKKQKRKSIVPVLATVGGASLAGTALGSMVTPTVMRSLGKNYSYKKIKKLRRKMLAGGLGVGILGGAGLAVKLLSDKEKQEIKKALGEG